MTDNALAITDTYNADVARMLGQTVREDFGLPRLATNSDHVVEIDGKDYNVPAGAFKLRMEGGRTVYGKKVTFRPIMQRYWFQWYDGEFDNGPGKNKGKVLGESVMIADFREEPYDSIGTVACGKVRGKAAKNPDNLSPAQKVRNKAVSTYRLLFGTVTIEDAATAEGDKVEVVDYPCELRLRGNNFMPFGEIEEKLTRAKRMLPQVELALSTRREKNGATTYYIIQYEYDPLKLRPITATDMALIKTFADHIAAHNDKVMAAHKDAVKGASGNLSASADGLDADFGEVEVGSEVE